MSNHKTLLLESGVFKPKGGTLFLCQMCPHCGDNRSHVYAWINETNDEPARYYCHKCNESHAVGNVFLEHYGLTHIKIPRFRNRRIINPNQVKEIKLDIDISDTTTIAACDYIQSRVGSYPTIEDLEKFRFIQNPVYYIREFLDNKVKLSPDRHWFQLNHGGMIGRYKNDDVEIRWLNLKPKTIQGKGIYQMKGGVDTIKPINVIIAEGVMDVIGLYYNYERDNNMYLAVLGSNYVTGLQHLLNIGIFGNHVNVRIFKDQGVTVKEIESKIDLCLIELFGKIEIFRNVKAKDYGVTPQKLVIEKCIK
jgi:hypothetical protein